MDKEEVRLYLQQVLEAEFPELPVIFRPSGNLRLTYPCIIYEPKAEEPAYANNSTYAVGTRFQVTFLSYLPGYGSTRLMFSLGLFGVVVSSNNSFVSDDVVHDVFIVNVHTI